MCENIKPGTSGVKRKISDDDDDYYENVKRKKKKIPKKKLENKIEFPSTQICLRKRKIIEEEPENWKWWKLKKKDDKIKWRFLEHRGPLFPPPYQRLPKNVKLLYNRKRIDLNKNAEEVATFYARLIGNGKTSNDVFNKNFFNDWRETMTPKEKQIITDLKRCDFRKIHAYFLKKSMERKAMSKEDRKTVKEENEKLKEKYGYCIIDGHKEKIGNFKIEPPSLFHGRGKHPKMGMLKRRIMPENVLINCSKDSKFPQPPSGHKWKAIMHDSSVSWLACWKENVQKQMKYVMLNSSSKMKGEKDIEKFETARKLGRCIKKIRQRYREEWKSKDLDVMQRSVALYFIDRLSLRSGNDKGGAQADTVGCCSLRVEHISLYKRKNGHSNVVVFDFLGKDSVRYFNEVPVEQRVLKNLLNLIKGKKRSDYLFDRLNPRILNKYLNKLMKGLTAKVFRTYNCSFTLQEQLKKLTHKSYSVAEKISAYNRANRTIAILCNHQRSVPKSYKKSMKNIAQKIVKKKAAIKVAFKRYKEAQKNAQRSAERKMKILVDKKRNTLERLKQQLNELIVKQADKEENKTVALGTSKLNYLDPRITVAWCKKFNIPIEKIFNKTQLAKFRWAIDLAGSSFTF